MRYGKGPESLEDARPRLPEARFEANAGRVTLRRDPTLSSSCRCLARIGRWMRLKLRVGLLAVVWV